MQYFLTPYSEAIQPFAWWEGAFNDQELDQLQQMAMNAKDRAQVGSNLQGDNLARIRRSNVSWLNNTSDSRWIFEKLAHSCEHCQILCNSIKLAQI